MSCRSPACCRDPPTGAPMHHPPVSAPANRCRTPTTRPLFYKMHGQDGRIPSRRFGADAFDAHDCEEAQQEFKIGPKKVRCGKRAAEVATCTIRANHSRWARREQAFDALPVIGERVV